MNTARPSQLPKSLAIVAKLPTRETDARPPFKGRVCHVSRHYGNSESLDPIQSHNQNQQENHHARMP